MSTTLPDLGLLAALGSIRLRLALRDALVPLFGLPSGIAGELEALRR
jgi:hypothetical protein